jgi:mannobiose 2-epimerase
MPNRSPLDDLRSRVEGELLSNILPFWLKYAVDNEYGGFRGQIANDLTFDAQANKGLILNARILWTFSRAFSVYREDAYLKAARRAFDYITQYFWDAQHNGVFWMVDHRGRPIHTKKRIYGQAFAIYGFAGYFAASHDYDALARAISLYSAVEGAARDANHAGYFETFEQDWTISQEQRLSNKDMDEKKSMNTHLHLLEAYTDLLRIWDNPSLRLRLRELLNIFQQRIIDPKSHHFWKFFDEEWRPRCDHISFGHDIEGSWLLCEAAEVLGDDELSAKVKKEAVSIAQAVHDEAVDADGGLLYEADPSGIIDTDKHWWPQAEAVIGFLNAYQLSGREHFLVAAQRTWDFIDKFIIDHARGEWYWRVSREGVPSDDEYKVDPWKGPYHNGRVCLEVMQRIDHLKP